MTRQGMVDVYTFNIELKVPVEMGPTGETPSESLLDAIFAYDDGSMFLAAADYERVIPRQMMA